MFRINDDTEFSLLVTVGQGPHGSKTTSTPDTTSPDSSTTVDDNEGGLNMSRFL